MTESVSARWHPGLAKVEVRHDRSDRKPRVYLRIDLEDAKKLRDDLTAVIDERTPDDD